MAGRGGGFKTPMSYKPELATTQSKPSKEDQLREELGLTGTENPDDFGLEDDFVDGDDDDEDISGTPSTRTSSKPGSAGEAHLVQKLRQQEKSFTDLTRRTKRYEMERNTLRQELDKTKQGNRTRIKMMKKGHEQLLADQRKLIQNLEDMVSEQEKAANGEGKSSTAVSLQRLVEQISSLHKDKTSLMDDNVELQLKVQEAEQDLEKEKLHLQGRIEKLKAKLENAMLATPEPTAAEVNQVGTTNPTEVMELKAEVEQLRNALAQSNEQKTDSTEATKKLQELQSAESAKKLKELQSVNESLQAQLRETQQAFKGKASEVDKDMQSKLDQAAAARARLEIQVKMAQEETATRQKTISDLQKKVHQLEAMTTELEALSKESGRQQGSVEEELTKTRLERKNLEVQVSTLTTEFNQLQAKVADLERSERELQDERRKLQAQLVDHQKTSASLSVSRDELAQSERQITDLRQDVTRRQEELTRTQEKAVADKARAVADTEQRIRVEMAGVEKRMSAMVSSVRAVQQELVSVKTAKQNITKDVLALQQAIGPGIKATRKQIASAIGEIDRTNKELVRKYKKEMQLRKKYHNEIVELKGNIRVFARVRPTIKEDGSGAQAVHVVTFDADDDGLISVGHRGNVKTFEMDKVFQSDSTQEQVFNEVKALLVSCVDGFNICIFAYGQTGSGKTFTMEGYGSNPGLNPRALQELFAVTEDRNKEWEYAITVSVMEIYNENIRDLLSDSPTESKEVKQSRNPSDGHYVPGLTWIRVQTVDDVKEVFQLGKENRATAVTDMNEHSSRSHALLSIMVVGTNRTTGVRTIGRLNLVDLAGSERIAKSGSEGQRLKEAQNINKSLSALGDVIHSLKSKSSHVPYRNSKLTYLLQDSLGGDSKTLMMVQASPVEKNSSETLCSLNFAQRVKSVELGQASRRTETSADSHFAKEHGDGASLTGRGSPSSGKRLTSAAARKR